MAKVTDQAAIPSIAAGDVIHVVDVSNPADDPAGSSFKGTFTQIASFLASFAEVLTGKTIDLASNTVTGTLAEFQTAVSDATLASTVGTPVNDQIGVWTGDGTIEGTADLTFNGTKVALGGGATRIELGGVNSYWDFGVAIAGSNVLNFDASDYLEYDTVDNAFRFNIGAAPNPQVEIAEGVLRNNSESTAAARGMMHSQHSADTLGARMRLRKGRGTLASPTVAATGDDIGRMLGEAYDGATYLEMAAIDMSVEGTVAATRIPTKLSFKTATNATPSVLTERLLIDSAGLATFSGEARVATAGTAATSVVTVDGTQEITNKTVDLTDNTVTGTLAEFQSAVSNALLLTAGQETIWIPAGAMEPRVTTAPATSTVVEIGTSLIALRTMDFATDADDHAGFAIQMPKGWNEGTLIAQFVWSTTGAQTGGLDGVAWFIRARAYANDNVLTTALGTAVGVTQDHSATANDIMITSETAALTVAGAPGAEEWVYFEIFRDVSDAADDLDIDARLHGVKIHYTTDATNDN